MMDLMQAYGGNVAHWHGMLSSIDLNSMLLSDFWPMPDDWSLVIAQFKQTDLGGDVGKWWDNVVKTGQVWAFLLGAIFGYLAKSFTTYG